VKRTRREALKVLGLSACAAPLLARAQGSPPNVVFIITDDQQQASMGAYGNTILKTPNMDRIATGGIRFNEAFTATSLCAPSRASYFTGLYPHAHGITTNGDGPQFYNGPGLPRSKPTFWRVLGEAGYYTGFTGKWHLKGRPEAVDEYVIFPWQGEYQDPDMIANGARIRMRGHADDAVGDISLEFLKHRPRHRPFCLLISFKSPHRTWQPAERFKDALKDVAIPLPRTLEEKLEGKPQAVRAAEMALADMPDYQDRVPRSLPPSERRKRNLELMFKDYYRVLMSVDENVGRVLDALDRDGLARDTLVIYVSDNGFFLGEHGLYDKRLMYEPSIRVPMVMRYPGKIAPGTVNTRQLVLNVDIFPTVLQLAGVPVPAGLHGRSLVPLFSRARVPWRDAILYSYEEYPAGHCVRKHRGVRTERYKLIHFWEQPEEWELYDLAKDPDETRNLVREGALASTFTALKARLNELRREVGDVDPPGPRPVAELCKDGHAMGFPQGESK